MKLKDIIIERAPRFVKNLGVTFYNWRLYKARHEGEYKKWQKYHSAANNRSLGQIHAEAELRLSQFLRDATTKSVWYADKKSLKLQQFPVLEKTDLLRNLEKISTIDESDAIVSLTGGTTGASMKVLYTHQDMQERFAILDNFRAEYGYKLGKKTAWFSGKHLVGKADEHAKRFAFDDYLHGIRFFSTFHMADKNFLSYWESFVEFAPEFIVGFPSSVYDLCLMAERRNLNLHGIVKVFFPTAETVLASHRQVIGKVFGCRIVDQYASSEGAPFITECAEGSLHINPLTGVFEVVDENLNPAIEGRVASNFVYHFWYTIDSIQNRDRVQSAPEDFRCACGSHFPVALKIDGRTSDFVFSKENGKVNLGNLSNCTKDVQGIEAFQIIQDELSSITVKVVGTDDFDLDQEGYFLQPWFSEWVNPWK
ncbi:phenylacetate--CoA ligase family protein [Variovorax sp. UC122_21]|uniref:phenylacetate--CoA ligase family protein n=1 Tax=Variovorax sp. UC122_21 TaxID=3374554 RepID=UPI003757D7B0